jgi:type IV fimbrial biogenesis protein FimT
MSFSNNHFEAPDGARPAGGFTVLELLVVLVVIAIVAAIGLPGLASAGRGLRLDGAAQQLASDLAYARMDAIKRNASVFVARSGSAYVVEHVGVRVLEGVTIEAWPSDTIRFSAFGPVSGAGEYVLGAGDETRTVRLTGGGLATVE